jgi:hypothetical protein
LKTRKAESVYCFTCRSGKKINTAGVFGGRPDQAGFDSRSIFNGALVEE